MVDPVPVPKPTDPKKVELPVVSTTGDEEEPEYETLEVVDADGTKHTEIKVVGEIDEPTDQEVEEELNGMIKDVQLVEETTKTAVELSEKLTKESQEATTT